MLRVSAVRENSHRHTMPAGAPGATLHRGHSSSGPHFACRPACRSGHRVRARRVLWSMWARGGGGAAVADSDSVSSFCSVFLVSRRMNASLHDAHAALEFCASPPSQRWGRILRRESLGSEHVDGSPRVVSSSSKGRWTRVLRKRILFSIVSQRGRRVVVRCWR